MASALETGADVAEALVEAAATLHRWMTRPEVRETLKGTGKGAFDLGSPRGFILTRLVQEGPARVTELAAWLGVDKSTITPQVAALESLGFLTRRPDPSDGRAHQLVVTPAGRRAFASTVATAREAFRDLLSAWSEEDLLVLTGSLTRLRQEFESLDGAEGRRRR